ncbi:hypothetical protein PENSPDRAFT_692419 [Peniophora sp. CONT]|nr:hypothetical protein PENSPDRAFT_692419 [Peniophora sp. CONT]
MSFILRPFTAVRDVFREVHQRRQELEDEGLIERPKFTHLHLMCTSVMLYLGLSFPQYQLAYQFYVFMKLCSNAYLQAVGGQPNAEHVHIP